MAKILYVPHSFRPDSLTAIEQANEIIGDYAAEGYTLTLRQLYYQFVSRNLIPNTERSYKNLGTVITKGREAGLIDWDGIEDRAREHHGVYINEEEGGVLDGLEQHLALDRWAAQDHYIEVWVEKEALGNVIERPCRRWRVSFMACKGYLSASQAWQAGMRFQQKICAGKQPVLIHLGDHDPSGIDMTRDNKNRLELFSESDVEVIRLALNMDQVEQYSPPPNPAKLTDSRVAGYIDRFGKTSWELDALEPSVIDTLIDEAIRGFIDKRAWDKAEREEKKRRQYLSRLSTEWDEIKEFLDGRE